MVRLKSLLVRTARGKVAIDILFLHLMVQCNTLISFIFCIISAIEPIAIVRNIMHMSDRAVIVSAKCARMKREFEFAKAVINTITWLLIVAINVSKPPHTPSDYTLEVLAMLVE